MLNFSIFIATTLIAQTYLAEYGARGEKKSNEREMCWGVLLARFNTFGRAKLLMYSKF